MNYAKESNHSNYLRGFFDISANDIDYYNQYEFAFEFKETIKEINDNCRTNRIQFNCHKNHLENSDYYIFCFRDKEFYLVESKIILNHYNINNKYNIAFVSVRFILNNALVKSNDMLALKDFIDSIKEVI